MEYQCCGGSGCDVAAISFRRIGDDFPCFFLVLLVLVLEAFAVVPFLDEEEEDRVVVTMVVVRGCGTLPKADLEDRCASTEGNADRDNSC